MGRAINKTSFSQRDFNAFGHKLHRCLNALELLLERPGFGCGETSIGAELELYLLDRQGLPLPKNVAIQKQFDDPRLTLELNRYNLEYNLNPVKAAGEPFSTLEQQMLDALHRLQLLTEKEGGSVLPIGILPTLRRDDFGESAMTDEPRYHALANVLHQMRDQSCGINIDGEDAIHLVQSDVTMEGACTSFQLHYRVEPSRFTSLWNCIQLVTPLVLGLAANSPLLLGHRLWHETRVPLFKQSIDGRGTVGYEWRDPARVSFGHGWLSDDPMALFREMVQLYRPMIPLRTDEDPVKVVEQGGVPRLEELCLHDGTIWSWNRPIYDPEGDAHLRIEMRALPAGPTPIDMAANSALFIGLAEGLVDQVAPLLSALPFPYAEYNFYRASQFGLEAKILWPDITQNGLQERPLVEVVRQLLPVAAQGLEKIGVDYSESQRLLAVIDGRLSNGRTGAIWQMTQYSKLLSGSLSRLEACQQLVAAYGERSISNTPVSEWSDI
jgi:gamma-glutamyl:cysteine ligase YbdK (ATP-grasp superfamily)